MDDELELDDVDVDDVAVVYAELTDEIVMARLILHWRGLIRAVLFV